VAQAIYSYLFISSHHPANSVKAVKLTQSTDPNQWPDLILSSSITRLPSEGVLDLYVLPCGYM